MQEILEPLSAYPQRLNLTEQGLFGLGYYHQRQALYKNASPKADTDETD